MKKLISGLFGGLIILIAMIPILIGTPLYVLLGKAIKPIGIGKEEHEE